MAIDVSIDNAPKSVSDRAQQAAFWGALFGFCANTVLMLLYVKAEGLNPLLLANYLFYSFAILAIVISSYLNKYFAATLLVSICAVYLHMWSTTYFGAMYGASSKLSLLILLFVPLCFVVVANCLTLTWLAVFQTGAVFLYVDRYFKQVFQVDWPDEEIRTIAIVLALMSGVTLGMLAIMAFARDKTDQRLLEILEAKERLADEDPLTGLKNRRAFMEEVQSLWSQEQPMAIMFMDLNRFKPLNDEFGHAAGDLILNTIADRLSAHPVAGMAGRFGGDEFAILISAPKYLANLDAAVRSVYADVTARINIQLAEVSVGVSCGYAVAYEHGKNIHEFLHAADAAMMRCKASSQKIARFDPALDNVSLSAPDIEKLFRCALREDKIKAALQPVVCIHTGDIKGYELLARWPDSGLPRDPSPMEFIPIAEKLGLLNDLLMSTLKQAIPHVLPTNAFLAVNVSSSQLSSRNFLSRLAGRLEAFGFPHERLEIEITETVAMRNLEENVRVLETAKARGCRIVLDDFGTGYSSLSLLNVLPLDKIKLDKSLLQGGRNKDVFAPTVRLAKDVGFECCIEGIETEEQALLAKRLGCDLIQGFWHSRAIVLDGLQDTDPLALREAS